MVEIEDLEGLGEGLELALPGDMVRRRHIATRASLRRKIIVLVVGDVEFDGYSIGLDEYTLQILELPSGEVSSIALDHIVSISDGKPFNKLTPAEKEVVEKRTSSFYKTCHKWLTSNWPNVYNQKTNEERRPSPRPYARPYDRHSPDTEGSITNAD